MKKKALIFSTISISVLLLFTILAYGAYKFFGSHITVETREMYLYLESRFTVMKVEYHDIKDAKLEDTIYGNIQLDGVGFNNCEVGVFQNEARGKYYSFVEKKSKKSIVLKLDNSVNFAYANMVIGLASLEETTKLFENIQKMITLEN